MSLQLVLTARLRRCSVSYVMYFSRAGGATTMPPRHPPRAGPPARSLFQVFSVSGFEQSRRIRITEGLISGRAGEPLVRIAVLGQQLRDGAHDFRLRRSCPACPPTPYAVRAHPVDVVHPSGPRLDMSKLWPTLRECQLT